ncbi:MAG: electron transport complex subunit E [Gammaproteobacteria bacterium]|nr:electron transport complex subunit E [Gammaproteobacteria bacterium]
MSDVTPISSRFRRGLWDDNPGLVQLLGLCPLLAVTSNFINGLGLGLATLAVMALSNLLVSATRRWIASEIRIPMYVVIIASLVTCIELVFKAWFPALDRTLGIFIPLIVTNCAILARAEVYASRNGILDSVIDGVVMGSGFAALLCCIGFFRELIGRGTMFARMDMLFGGEPMPGIQLADNGLLLLLLPPGAFLSLAIAVASKKAIDRRRQKSASFRLSI